MKKTIVVQTEVNLPLKETWSLWTDPMHIIQWNAASPDWHTTYAENDLKVNGFFSCRMEAKDGSVGFDFAGNYTHITPQAKIEYEIADGRKVKVNFSGGEKSTNIAEEFDPEQENSHEMQRAGWQSILDNFKKYAESRSAELLRFKIKINSSIDKVYKIFLAEKPYQEWTKVFNPHSTFIGSWNKGAMIRFIGIDEMGNRRGMLSRIRENMPAKFVSIEHLGIIHGEKEIMSGPEVSGWAGALENYKLTPEGQSTIFEVFLDSNQEFKSYFLETWPKALQELKTVCEKG
jgi:uncharacterized protein YndB with AHSA1/START domain